MKFKNYILVIPFLMLATGCVTTDTAPFETSKNGHLIHIPSGVQFPELLDSFQRTFKNVYSRNGDNISVGYNLSTAPIEIAATIYVYPAPRVTSIGSSEQIVLQARNTLFNQVAEQEIASILYHHPSAELIRKSRLENQIGDKNIQGIFAQFKYTEIFNGKKQEIYSELYLYQKENRLIKYRISYPAIQAIRAAEQISSLMNKFHAAQK